ncbi:MAG: Na+:solute symporter [Phycisphaeraceae bacterium]
MAMADYIVLTVYLVGIFAVGVGLSRKVKDTKDLFAAGERSPWWASGLSGFMTMFSAGTFVVWGGIAYRLGFVAVAINLMYGIAAILVGLFLAGRWKRLGLRTPAQFIQMRFGGGALHFYTWSMMLYRMTGVGVALYSLAILLVALMPLGEGNPLRDPTTGNLSLTWAILIFGGVVVIYTMVGGLWAVLMTDVLQFIVLNLAVLFMIPLIFMDLGGVGGFVSKVPSGFFYPTAGSYTWFFLAGWCAIHFFMVGAEWAFAQRYICVPSEKDARKSAFLFGALYLVSPILWLMPPLAWRVIQPIPEGATQAEITAMAEQAYILACKHVLPVGMVGLMIAAMFSATASMVSSQINVFASVLTQDVYAKFKAVKSERELLWAGRLLSCVLGVVLIGLALAVPMLGGAEKVVIAITSLMVAPLLAPTVLGLLNRNVGQSAVWITAGICIPAGLLAKFVFAEQLLAYGKTPEILLGVVLPVVVLTVIAIRSKKQSVGWKRVERGADAYAARQQSIATATFDASPAYIVAGCLVVCAVMMACLVAINPQDRFVIGVFGGVLLVLASAIAGAAFRWSRRASNSPSSLKDFPESL